MALIMENDQLDKTGQFNDHNIYKKDLKDFVKSAYNFILCFLTACFMSGAGCNVTF